MTKADQTKISSNHQDMKFTQVSPRQLICEDDHFDDRIAEFSGFAMVGMIAWLYGISSTEPFGTTVAKTVETITVKTIESRRKRYEVLCRNQDGTTRQLDFTRDRLEAERSAERIRSFLQQH